MNGTRSKTRVNPLVIIMIAVVVLLTASGAIAQFYTDVLWFEDLGHASVFWRTLGWQWGTGVASALLFFAILYVNLRIARAMAPTTTRRAFEGPTAQLEAFLEQIRASLGRVGGFAILAVSVIGALIAGSAAASSWQHVALALSGNGFGLTDPQFGRDLGFYFFTLPALELLRSWLTGALVVTLLLTAVVHVLNGSIRPWDRWRGFDPHVKGHLSVLAGLIVVVQAFSYWLNIFELSYSPRGQVVGASYTDIHAQVPAFTILIGIALLSGLALIVNIRFRGWRLPVIALGTWIVASIVIGGIYPALVQQFRVAPNEVEAETPYIERNIAATRAAFGLDDVEVRAFSAEENLTAAGLVGNERTLQNVRLWDPKVAVQTYQQLQGIRPYYDFYDVDIDRYVIDGEMREVLISARELDITKLATQAQTWVNQHLVYTHGYGLVVSPVNEASTQGYPRFILHDLPPASDTDLALEQPALYFGEETTEYAIAGTDLPEFDYPVGDANAETSYSGKGGVALSNPLRRVAFTLRLSAPQILFSQYIRSDSKVLFRRTVAERVDALAPWLVRDSDPYPVIVDGRTLWVVDCYTVSDRYPYAERYNGVSYIRNAVKVTVDAYDGTTTLYAFDAKDPLLEAWGKVFPGLLTSAEAMPDELRAHLRYPEDLFRLQAEVYKTYHMQDPKVFYNKEDQWALPGEGDGTGQGMDPFYVLMQLPQESTEDFMLMMPFTPRTKANMIGWMAAKSDPATYGERVAYTFPKQRLVLGPEQVSARVNQDPVISQQLTLWNQRGSGVLFGNLLVVPIDDSIVYIQPLYLQAEQTAMPQLTRVIVTYGDKVAMEADLGSALLAVFGEAEAPPSEPGSAVVDAAAARDLYERALEAQRAGDWAAYGELIDQLGEVLATLSGEATTGPQP